MTAGFLNVDVLASRATENSGWRMPVVGGGYNQNIDSAVIQNPAKIADDLGVLFLDFTH
jgi:hypothetical protein